MKIRAYFFLSFLLFGLHNFLAAPSIRFRDSSAPKSAQQELRKFMYAGQQHSHSFSSQSHNYEQGIAQISQSRSAIDVTNQSQLAQVGARWNAALKQAQRSGDSELVYRINTRLAVLARTKATPTPSSQNIELVNLFINEFEDTYTQAQALASQYPAHIHAQMVAPLVNDIFKVAQKEHGIEKAFSYSDLAHDVVTIFKRGIKALIVMRDADIATMTNASLADVRAATQSELALIRGAFHGIRESLTLEHWKQVVIGTGHLIKAFGKKCVELGGVVSALDSYDDEHCCKVMVAFEQRGAQEMALLRAHFKQTWTTLKQKSWDQLLESGAEIGTMLLLDIILMNGAGSITSKAGSAFVSEVAMVFKRGDVAREAYCVEIATVGKTLVEEGSEATLAAFKELEKHPELITKTELSVGEVLAEEAEAIKINKVLEGLPSEKSATNLNKFGLSNELFIQKSAEQAKRIDEVLSRFVFEKKKTSTMYFKPGEYKDALFDFHYIEPCNIRPLPRKDGLIGDLYDGRTLVVRLDSRDLRPTLEFQEAIGKWTDKTKYRYGEK